MLKEKERELTEIYSKLLKTIPTTVEGVEKTPHRAAKALCEMLKGYSLTPQEAVGQGIFISTTSSVVSVKGLELCSLCEHHLLPFVGTCAIAYVPDGKILGLSKLKRLVEVFSRRLQVQERLTEQIAASLQDLVKPKGVMVVIRAMHLCMKMRGVNEKLAETTTVVTKGVFTNNEHLKSQFWNESSIAPKL
jgi:GTP cyclohydrolase I